MADIWCKLKDIKQKLKQLHKTSTHWLLLEQTKNQVRKEVKMKQAFYLLWLANMKEMDLGAKAHFSAKTRTDSTNATSSHQRKE